MEDGIRTSTAALVEALRLGDAARAAALYDLDGRLLTPAAELLAGRAQIESFWRAGIAVGLTEVRLDPVELELVDGVGVEVGRYALELGATTDAGKYLALHRRRPDGTWCRAADVFNPDVPHARPEPEEEP
jgi:ketosteroid isomerase-like protein